MDPIRVIGRIDLAQQIHAALLGEGADVRLATAAPMAVIAETGRDGTGIDVIANGFELCPKLKKAAPGRPVVMVTFEEVGGAMPTAAACATHIARTSRGPDAHLPWPAGGGEILAACERARVTARVPRPLLDWRSVWIWILLITILGATFWALGVQSARPYAPFKKGTLVGAALVKLGVFVAIAFNAWWGFRRARTTARRRWSGWLAPLIVVGALQSVLDLVRALRS